MSLPLATSLLQDLQNKQVIFPNTYQGRAVFRVPTRDMFMVLAPAQPEFLIILLKFCVKADTYIHGLVFVILFQG